ncbi:hypothetical protein M9H77_10233 [Catharanthus roseus]|uniref:Uncharacterized protein n=1 Tax=Catharanthus roseus TaxID=4058 RepID=A0ACC0C2S1_CATRO|nr:hypothetical protein M9H77_10233 [Catharanthus roseus]
MAEMLPTIRNPPTALGQSVGQSMAPPVNQQPLSQPVSQQQMVHPPNEIVKAQIQPVTPMHPQPVSQIHAAPHPFGEVPHNVHHAPLNPSLPSAAKAIHSPAAIIPVATNRQLMRGDRHLFSASDDSAMMKQVLSMHVPDGRDFDVKPLLLIIEDIMKRAKPVLSVHGDEHHAQVDTWDDKGILSGFTDVLELLAYPISKTSSEIVSKCSAGGDAHSTTMGLLQSLSSYSWEAKVAISFAAFAVYYGEFWLVAQLYPTNPLAKSIAVLMELPEIMEHRDAMKQKFEAVNKLIEAMLLVTHCIIRFKELPTQYISHDLPEMITAAAHIPTAVYWTIRSIVACSSLLMNLIALGHEFIVSAAEAWELSSLAHKLANIKEHLEKQIGICNHKIEEKKQNDAFYALHRLFETPHIDNMKILRALIYAKEDQLPLYDGTHRRRVGLDVLRRKHVLLLISDLEMSHEELSILHQMYSEARAQPTKPESQYEVVWIPVIDRNIPWTEEKQKQFEEVQKSMPWYSVAHPSMLEPAVLRFIKEVWGFTKRPQLVVLDPQGKESNRNALHMMWIWGSTAFPFTKAKEEALWREETWRLDLLADSIDQNLLYWMAETKYICLYGGEDMDWIRKFTTTARSIANAAGIQLEMLYVGKSNPKEKVRRNNALIQSEKLSHVLPDLTLIWFFWVRLESMWHSKVQHGMTVENDAIMQEIVTMLSFDGSDQGWAVFCRGSHEMAKGRAETVLQCLNEFDRWKDTIVYPDGFVFALDEQLRGLKTAHHCSRLILPGATGKIPEKVVCAECGRTMEKFIMYRCCDD